MTIQNCVICSSAYKVFPSDGHSLFCSKKCQIEGWMWNFWSKVKRGTDCWIWTGAKYRFGHGCLNLNQKRIAAHRLSWELHFGKIPEGMHVCHKCDVPQCVNPRHLFLGKNIDNRRDSCNKMRHAFGERSGHAKLTDEDVLEIRSRSIKYGQQVEIAKEFGISKTAVHGIVHRKSWKHLP